MKAKNPALFYQLDDFQPIDYAYRALRMHDNIFKAMTLLSDASPFQVIKAASDQLATTFKTAHSCGLDEQLLSKVGAAPIIDPSKWEKEMEAELDKKVE